MPVRWTDADASLSEPWPATNGSGERPAPASLAGRLGDLSGDIADVFSAVPSRRLVVLGSAGAGKSVLAVWLAMELLRGRAGADDRLPVILPLSTWDPNEGLRGWAMRRLVIEHPWLGAATRSGVSIAAELVHRGRLLLVLDGLDEMPAHRRGAAVRELNRSLGRADPVVLTSRLDEYRDTVADGEVLTAAAAVSLAPLELADLRDYLPRTTRRTGADGGTKWDPVLDQMAARPDHSLCAVLATPLMTALARTAYSDTRADPMELLDPKRFPSRASLEDHLLDRLVPAVYDEAADDRTESWSVEDARRWLGFLARHLGSSDGVDLVWWRWRGPWAWCVAAVGLTLGLIGSTLAIRALPFTTPSVVDGRTVPPWLAFTMWSMPVVAALLWAEVRNPPSPRRVGLPGWRRRLVLWSSLAAVIVLLGSSFVGLPLAVATVLGGLALVRATPVTGADVVSARDPATLLGADRTAVSAFGLCYPFIGPPRRWLMLPILFAAPGLLLVWQQNGGYGHVSASTWLVDGCVAWLLCVAYGFFYSAWVRFTVLRLALAAAGRLPWRLMNFLEDAHRRGVLRQSGGGYRFRHARLQERLAGRSRGTTRHAESIAARPRRRLRGIWPIAVASIVLVYGMGQFASQTLVAPGAPGPFTTLPSPCALVASSAAAALTAGAPGRLASDHLTGSMCTWTSPDTYRSGTDKSEKPKPDRTLQVATYLGAPSEGRSAIRDAELFYTPEFLPTASGFNFDFEAQPINPSTSGVPGLCAEAQRQLGLGVSGLPAAVVIVRCGNAVLGVLYSALQGEATVTAVARLLADEVVGHTLGKPVDERATEHALRALLLAPKSLAGPTWSAASDKSVVTSPARLDDTSPALQFSFRIPAYLSTSCFIADETDNTWTCESDSVLQPDAPYFHLFVAANPCPGSCSTADWATANQRWPQTPVSTWTSRDTTTRYAQTKLSHGPAGESWSYRTPPPAYMISVSHLWTDPVTEQRYVIGAQVAAAVSDAATAQRVVNDIWSQTQNPGQ